MYLSKNLLIKFIILSSLLTFFTFSLFYSAVCTWHATKVGPIFSFPLLVEISRKVGLGKQRAGPTIRSPKAGGFLCFTAGLLLSSYCCFQIGRGQTHDRVEGDVDIILTGRGGADAYPDDVTALMHGLGQVCLLYTSPSPRD